MDSGKTAAVFEAMKTTIGLFLFWIRNKNKILSLGMDISPIDLINIESFANRVIHLFEYRKSLQEVKDFFFCIISIIII
jgi:RNA processing factor Prp31